MKNKYFDVWEFEQALNSSKCPQLAKNLFENYIKKYPNDYSAYPHYINLLTIFQEFDKAEDLLSYVLETAYADKNWKSFPFLVDAFENKILYTKLSLYIYKGDYEKVLHLWEENFQKIMDYGVDKNMYTLYYCQKQLGLLNEERENKNYLMRQMIEYSENEFLEHAKRHLSEFMPNRKSGEGIFSSFFPFEKAVKKIKQFIPSENKLCMGYFQDRYFFKYNGCGRTDKKIDDFFTVICFHNTSDFITMYPTSEYINVPYVDLNDLLSTNSLELKTKQLSQIEKFNHKWNKNNN